MKPDWSKLPPHMKKDFILSFMQPGMKSCQIAACFDNASRSAVIGFCNRQDIALPRANGRRDMPERNGRQGKTAEVRVVAPKPKPVPKPKLEPIGVAFLDALNGDHCKWPMWDDFVSPTESLCCGLPKIEGRPYCAMHVKSSEGVGTASERSAHRALKREFYPAEAR